MGWRGRDHLQEDGAEQALEGRLVHAHDAARRRRHHRRRGGQRALQRALAQVVAHAPRGDLAAALLRHRDRALHDEVKVGARLALADDGVALVVPHLLQGVDQPRARARLERPQQRHLRQIEEDHHVHVVAAATTRLASRRGRCGVGGGIITCARNFSHSIARLAFTSSTTFWRTARGGGEACGGAEGWRWAEGVHVALGGR